MKINLFDNQFDHSIREDGGYTCSMGRLPTKLEWVKNNMIWDGITVFTESAFDVNLINSVQSTLKIGWVLESKAISPYAYTRITEIEHLFDYILTHDKTLLSRSNKYQKVLVGASRVKDEDWEIAQKSKLCSIIASHKRWNPGHNLRYDAIEMIQQNHFDVDLFGHKFTNFESKLDPLQPYYYSIAIQNISNENYFTEILTDCFALGTIPILWGLPNANEYFDVRGILQFSTITELKNILENVISIDHYNSAMPHVINNFELAKQYKSTDDIVAVKLIEIWENHKLH